MTRRSRAAASRWPSREHEVVPRRLRVDPLREPVEAHARALAAEPPQRGRRRRSSRRARARRCRSRPRRDGSAARAPRPCRAGAGSPSAFVQSPLASGGDGSRTERCSVTRPGARTSPSPTTTTTGVASSSRNAFTSASSASTTGTAPSSSASRSIRRATRGELRARRRQRRRADGERRRGRGSRRRACATPSRASRVLAVELHEHPRLRRHDRRGELVCESELRRRERNGASLPANDAFEALVGRLDPRQVMQHALVDAAAGGSRASGRRQARAAASGEAARRARARPSAPAAAPRAPARTSAAGRLRSATWRRARRRLRPAPPQP